MIEIAGPAGVVSLVVEGSLGSVCAIVAAWFLYDRPVSMHCYPWRILEHQVAHIVEASYGQAGGDSATGCSLRHEQPSALRKSSFRRWYEHALRRGKCTAEVKV
jgi:hypothetical protein